MIRRLALASVLFGATAASAADGDGGLPANFLSLGLGAREAGLGFASAAGVEGTAALVWNPAGLARIRKGEASAGSVLLPLGVRYFFAGGAVPTIGLGHFGIAVARLAEGSVEGRDAANVAGASMNSGHTAFLLGYGRTVGPVMAGASVVVLQHGLGGTSATGFTASLGGQADLGAVAPSLSGFSLGVRAGQIVPSSFGSSKVPLSLRAGADWRKGFGAVDLGIAADADMTTGRALRPGAGFEATYRQMASLRLGWNGWPTLGIGGSFGPLRVDYAVAFLELGMSHRVSAAYLFGTDLSRPIITVKDPIFGPDRTATIAKPRVDFHIVVESTEPLKSVKVAGRPMQLKERNRFELKQPAGLRDGKNSFRIEVETVSGKRADESYVVLVDTKPPAIEIAEPKQGTRTKADQIQLRAVVTDASEIMAVSVNDLPVFLQPADRVEILQSVPLAYGGRHVIRIAATDRMGHTGTAQVEVGREGGPQAPAGGEVRFQASVDEQTARQSLEKGKEYAKINRWDVAAAELRYALKLNPALTEAKELLAQADQKLTEQPAATPAPAGGGSGGGDSHEMSEVKRAMDAHFARGKQLFDLGQYRRAEAEFRLVLELNKQYTAANDLLKRCKEKIDEFNASKLKEAKLAREKGQLRKELNALTDLLTADSENSMALEMRQQATTRIPAEKRRLHLRALDLYAQGNVPEALNVWKEARELDPDDEQIRKAIEKAEQKLIELRSGELGK